MSRYGRCHCHFGCRCLYETNDENDNRCKNENPKTPILYMYYKMPHVMPMPMPMPRDVISQSLKNT